MVEKLFVTIVSLMVTSGITTCFLAFSVEFWFFKPSPGLEVAVGSGFNGVEALAAVLHYSA